jgi:hypothetical protein
MTLDELQKQRDQILAAMGRTVSSIQFEQRKTEFRSPEELLTALKATDAQITALSGQQESRVFVVASSGGYYSTGGGCSGGGDSFEVWR